MGEFEVGTKRKVVHHASNYSVQILEKGKVTKLNYKVWAGFGILEKELVAGPHVSGTNRLTKRGLPHPYLLPGLSFS
jgi:hypothetical protein